MDQLFLPFAEIEASSRQASPAAEQDSAAPANPLVNREAVASHPFETAISGILALPGGAESGRIDLLPGNPFSVGPRERIAVPYRSQLDGSPWERANCGPTALSMGLASLGIDLSTAQLRQETLRAQGLAGNNVGTLMEALAKVAEQDGAQVVGLRDGARLKQWTIDDLRTQVRAGHPIIVQVFMRGLPGRQDWPAATDHYLVITGLVGDNLLYNDPIDVDGPGNDRVISPTDLERAMKAGDRRYAFAGFALATR